MIDVLVIGSGGAGLSAALNAKYNDAKVLVVSKTYPTHSQTCQAQGGINAVLKHTKNDSIENFTNDTYKASHKLANKKTINSLCENSQNIITWLDSIAVPFSRDEENNIAQRKFGGTKAKRTCYSSDYTGLKILHTLYDQCIKEKIEFLNEHFLLSLIIEKNEVKGATFLDITNSKVIEIKSKTTIIATGGYSGIYHLNTTNSYSSTGDGIVSALKAGVNLSNMEFIQFHPTSLASKNILISESARGEGGYLVDEKNSRFIDELKPRDEVARAIYEKRQKKEKVYLDLRHLGMDKINEIMPQERRLIFDFSKLDLAKDLIPVSPSAHYTMGGILTNEKTQTSIKNLFACGECAQSGIHGANRLGGNSLLEIISLGKTAGLEASKLSKKISSEQISSKQYEIDCRFIDNLYKKDSSKNFYENKIKLGEKLFENVGLHREENKLKETLNYIEKLKSELNDIGITDKSRIYNKNLCDLLEYRNLILLAEIITSSAINRKESRGAHFRLDYPEENSSYEKYTLIRLNEGKINISLGDIV